MAALDVMPPKPPAAEGWRGVKFGVVAEAVNGGRMAWFRLVEPGRAARLGLRVAGNGAEYEFKLRGGAWLRRIKAMNPRGDNVRMSDGI